MKAGAFRDRVTIQEYRVVDRSDEGEEVRRWCDVKTVWADADEISGNRFISQRQENSEISTSFVLRWMDGLDSNYRIVWLTVVYNIEQVIKDRAKRQMTILASADAVK